MKVQFRTIRLTKLFPLQISRGTSTGSSNLFVFVEDDGHVGVGECAPGTGDDDVLSDRAQKQLEELISSGIDGLGPYQVWEKCHAMGVEEPALAGLDIALWDLLAKKANMPLYKMLGLELPTAVTSVTIGINPVDVIQERVPEILRLWKGRALKIKLGGPDGVEGDKESYEAAREAAKPFNVKLRVDANGGWTQSEAIMMAKWLADRECDYLEQPLPQGAEDDLHALFKDRPLPIYLDESIRLSSDVTRFADRCDGVNLKLMKTGGITEAMRLVAAARAHGLKTMIGCMGESSVSIAAGAAIGYLFDHIDLDAHFNLNPDPAEGLRMVAGVVMPRDVPGHGAEVVE
jgi:L-alanine-DL-glutamate epimerase-like enolase superfamily enzyme